MEWYEVEVSGRRTIKFPSKVLKGRKNLHIGEGGGGGGGRGQNQSTGSDDSNNGGDYGGIIKRGEWAWLANGCTLHIVSLRNGQTMSTFEFAESKGYEGCSIRGVEELFPGAAGIDSLLLAVTLVRSSMRGSFVALYSVEHSTVLSCAELPHHVTCARFMSAAVCRRSLLQNFDGCLALGSEEGVVVLLDLNVRKLLAAHESLEVDVADAFVPCHIIDYNLPLTEIHRTFRQCQQDGVHFALQVEVIESPCSIQCILPIDLILGFAIGLEDGRLALYDLAELQIFYITMPQQEQEMSPLMKMEFLLPPDDPRPCMYVWALHEGEDELAAVLHSFMYEKRLTDDDDLCYFETFQTSSVRLQLTLESGKCLAISCQSILTLCEHREDDSNCLCALTWYSEEDETNKLMIYDLNQWYKEEMPFVVDEGSNPSFLAGYILNGKECGLHAYMNASTIAHFNSMQRFEEHFYPNSLSFDCTVLLPNACRSYNWEGAQNRVINILRSSHATIFLEPDLCFSEILRTRLMPQFSDMNLNATFSRRAKYDIILSVALENNCFSLLRDCAKCWADGSFMGNFTASTGLSLSTLTEWIWQRATDIKTRCNDLCKGLFDFGGYPLDQREQRELGFITRQLKLLSDLLAEVLAYSKRSIPDKVYATLDSRHKSLRMAADYQDILLWLLNIGLLPEASPCIYANVRNAATSAERLVPYPYTQLKETYAKKRTSFAKISETFVSKQSGSCRLLYIDAFIEHECKGKVLRDFWSEGRQHRHNTTDDDGLYPPASIESMLRVMLVPDVSFDSKCAILLYFFLDLHQAIDEQAYKSVVANFIKFPSVFKLSASLIKTVQAFWNLDHGHFLPAVDEFISPFNNNQNYPQWLLELLIETLLTQNSANLALRILEARPTLISPVLKLKTLLSNELISEAFHFARAARQNDTLLELFFSCCLGAGKFSVIRDLALSEHEGQLVQKILKRSQTHGAENLHFVYLLQKSKYIEAVSYMDELSTSASSSKSKCIRPTNFGAASSAASLNMDTPNLVLSAFNTTMTPVTQGLTDVYFRIKNKIKKKETDNKSPVPLSCQLIKQNANNLLGGIYHSSALSAHFATYYWGGNGGSDMEEQSQKRGNSDQRDHSTNLLSCSNNAPFLRKPQIETHYLDFLDTNAISYPQIYQASSKRTLAQSETSSDDMLPDRQNPKKRRRLLGRQEISNDLSHFKQTNKDMSRLNYSEFNITSDAIGTVDNPTKLDVVEGENNFLIRPHIKRRLSQDPDDSARTSSAMMEIHGILKTNTPEPTQRAFGRRELLAPEESEKNLRFRLPAGELVKASRPGGIQASLNDNEMDEDDNEEDEIELLVELQPSITTPEKHKNITRSISVDSNSSSSKSVSEENFYSPLSSQNTSLVIDNSRVSGILNASELQRSANKYRNLSGPQPRKPLARLSAERSEKSPTPEPTQESSHSILQYMELKPRQHIVDSELSTETETIVEKTVQPIKIQNLVTATKTGSFGSLAPSSLISTVNSSSSSQTISAVTSLASKITEFSPMVSSSKVCETQSKFTLEKTQSHVKFSEASTVLGGQTYFESTLESSKDFTMPNASTNHPKPLESKLLDTTLGMSSYDLTVCDATSPPIAKQQESKSATQLLTTAKSQSETESSNPDSKEQNTGKTFDIYNVDNDADDDEEGDIEMDVNESDLFDEALGFSGHLSSHDVDSDDRSDEEQSIDSSISRVSSPQISNSQSETKVTSQSESEASRAYSDENSSSGSRASKDQENTDDVDDNNVIVLLSSDSSDRNIGSSESGDRSDDSKALVAGKDSDDSNDEEEQEETEGEETEGEETEGEESDSESTSDEEVGGIYDEVADMEEESLNRREESHDIADEVEIVDVNKEEDSESEAENNQEVIKQHEKTVLEHEEQNLVIEKKLYDGPNKEHDLKMSVTEVKDKQPPINISANDKNLKIISQEKTHVFEESTNVMMSTEVKDNKEVVRPDHDQEQEIPDHINEQSNVDSATIMVKEVEQTQTESMDSSVIKEKTSDNITSNEDFHELVPVVDKSTEQEILQNLPDQLTVAKEQTAAQESQKPASEEKKSSTDDMESSMNITMNMEFVFESEPVLGHPIKVDPAFKVGSSVEITSSDDAKDVKISDSQTTEEEITLRVDEDELSENEAGKLLLDINNKANDTTGKDIEALKPDNPDNASTKPSTSMENDNNKLTTETQSQNIDETECLTNKRTNSVTKNAKVSETPLELELKPTNVTTPQRRNTRGISVPPQIQVESEDTQVLTPRNRRNIRASSLQPKVQLHDEVSDVSVDTGTPRSTARRNLRSATISPESAATLTIQVPETKIITRRRSVLQLDAINEDALDLDSPSTRTRSRVRLNSMDSDLNASIVSGEQPPQAKRTRRGSFSSTVSEQQPQTPKRTRRNSISSQGGGGTPRTLRGRSVVSNAADEAHETATPSRRTAAKRKKSTEDHLDATIAEEDDAEMKSASAKPLQKYTETEDGGKKKKLSPSPNAEPSSSAAVSYSSSRRLTRTQLAMLEIADRKWAEQQNREAILPSYNKRMSKGSTSRLNTAIDNHDSDDDGESISSHQSNFSIPASKRRVTRSSVKDKDETDDDLASISSSVGSETRSKRRSKEKNSPNTTLSAIPEDDSEAHTEPKKRGRRAKK